jgi:hypothetical protein
MSSVSTLEANASISLHIHLLQLTYHWKAQKKKAFILVEKLKPSSITNVTVTKAIQTSSVLEYCYSFIYIQIKLSNELWIFQTPTTRTDALYRMAR